MRIYAPAGTAMLRMLVETGELRPAGGVRAVTRALSSAHPDADVEDLEYTAFADAVDDAVALLPADAPRRVVVSADVPDRLVTEHPDGTGADLGGVIKLGKVAAVHIDDDEAAAAIAAMLAAPGEPDPSVLDEHVLNWYAASELQELLAALGSSNP